MQAFKDSDTKEAKVRDVYLPTLQLLGNERDAFYEGAFSCFKLGDVLIALNASPLARSIPPEGFRSAFFAIFELFTRPGTFEFYLQVFRAIFGEDVDVEFIVPGPGQLQINIQSLSILQESFLARTIVSNAYVYEEVKTTNDDEILLFQGTLGLKTQSEVDALMIELYPAGIFVETDLELI